MAPLDSSLDSKYNVIGKRVPRPDGIDKVTGRAQYGADFYAPNMLFAKVLRASLPHARIKSIDISAAEKLSGVKAIVTSTDFNNISVDADRDVLENCIAHDRVLYDGHGVAAVAATSNSVAKAALKLIKVEYEKLPFVTDVDEAMKLDAPIIHKGRVLENVPKGFSENVTSFCEFGHGDLDSGFAKSDKIIERTFKTAATHQGYIEPHACLALLKLYATTKGTCILFY